MKLSDYSFGSIQAGDNKFTIDFIVHKDWTLKWWRQSGHRVVPEDLQKIIRRSPARIVFGSGANGRMKLTGSVKTFLDETGIDYEIHRTNKAVEKFNEYIETGKDVAAGLHLTC